MRKCNKCQLIKPLSDFGKDSRNKSGYKSWCKKCTNEYYNVFYQSIKVKKSESSKKRYAEKKPEILIKVKKYYEENKPKILLRNKLYIRDRKLKFPHLRNLSSFRTLVKRMLNDTSKQTFSYLGYDFEDLINSLGRPPEIGEQIDHKIPISWFKKGTEMKIIFSLENLQILSAFENASKGNRFCHDISEKYYFEIKPFIKTEYLNKLKHVSNRKNTVEKKP